MADDLHLGQIIATNNLYKDLIGGKFGIELEAHRVSKAGRLSRIDHSAKLGSRRMHPYLQTDYSETQAELVTEPVDSFETARDRLLQLQWVLRYHMADDESIWPLSMPPELKQDDLQWLDEKFERTWMQDYRNWLMHKYGSTHEIMCYKCDIIFLYTLSLPQYYDLTANIISVHLTHTSLAKSPFKKAD